MEFPVLATIAAVAFVVVVLLVIVYLSIRVVQQYEKMVVFRLGKTNESMVREPGLRFLVPIIDRPVKVDVREQFIEVPSQTTITRDNAPINVDFLIYWRISNPLKSVVNVVNFPGALQGVATTTLRAVIGDILLDEVLSKREQINEVLRVKLDEVTERWGGKVTTVEIREITPPRDVQDAMNRQLSAERTRRAVITESEGSRQAAINVAEGQKQAEILRAEGDRQSAILRAEGFSEALTRIFHAATDVDQKTMSLQYLETLKSLGASPSTKFVIPFEFTRLLEPFLEYVKPTADREAGGPRPASPQPGRSSTAATDDGDGHGGDEAARATRHARAALPAGRLRPDADGRVIRPMVAAGITAGISALTLRAVSRRAVDRLLHAPRTAPGEDALAPALDELGGEVVRLRARDGLRLAARWLPADGSDAAWAPDPHEAVLLLHGYSGSIAPDLLEYGPFLRGTAGVLGLDFRGHGELRRWAIDVRAARDRGHRRRAGLARRARDHPRGDGRDVHGRDLGDRRGRGPRRRLARGRGRRPDRAARRGPSPLDR